MINTPPRSIRVLFWVAPITEMAWPLQKFQWIKSFVPRLQNVLRTCGYDVESTMVISENLAAWMSSSGVTADGRVVAIPQGKLLGGYRYNALEEFIKYQETRRSSRFFSHLGKVVKCALGEGFCPDVVVSFSPSPFFRTMYPRALLLYHEYGMLSRPPYPETLYLDPYGVTSRNFAAEHAALINAVPAETPFLELLDRYRAAVREALCSNEFLNNYFRGISARFKKILLLPLSYEGFADARVNFPYQTQLEYVEHVLDVVSEDTAVILTQHVRMALDDAAVGSLKALHGNLFCESWYSNVPFFSQVAIPYCDACITQNSSLGYQAIFHRKLFVSVGGFCGGVADAHSVEGIRDVFSKEPMDRERFLVWVLRNHVADLTDLPVYLQGVLDAWLENPREVARPEDWPVSCSLDRFRRRIKRWIDKISPPALKGATMRVYFDLGKGCSEESKYVWSIAEGWPVLHLDREIDLPDGCVSLRYDPTEENIVEVTGLQLLYADGEIPLSRHNGCATGDGIVFYTFDPQVIFKLPSGVRKVTLRATVRKISEQESARGLSNKIRDVERQLTEKTRLCRETASKLEVANGFLASVKKSFEARDAKEEESARKLLTKTEECGKLEVALAEVRGEVRVAVSQRDALARDCTALREELRTADKARDAKEEESARKLLAKTEECGKLEAALAEMRGEVQVAVSQRDALARDCTALREELRTAERDVQSLTGERDAAHAMLQQQAESFRRQLQAAREQIEAKSLKKRFHRMVKWFLPYGVTCAWKRMAHGVVEDMPLMYYRGFWKRAKRVVKFSLPYGLVTLFKRGKYGGGPHAHSPC